MRGYRQSEEAARFRRVWTKKNEVQVNQMRSQNVLGCIESGRRVWRAIVRDYRVSDLDDNELALRAQQGVASAFNVLAERYRERLYAYARRRFDLSHEDAEDVTLDAFMNAWNGLKSWAPSGPFEAWLITIMKNACRDHIRKENNRRENLPEAF